MTGASILNLPERKVAKLCAICRNTTLVRERAGRLGVNTRMIPLKTDRPATSIIIRCQYGSGAAKTAAVLTAPITSHGTRGLVPAGLVFFIFAAARKLCQDARRSFSKSREVVWFSFLHSQNMNEGEVRWNEKSFPNPQRVLPRIR